LVTRYFDDFDYVDVCADAGCADDCGEQCSFGECLAHRGADAFNLFSNATCDEAFSRHRAVE